MPASPTIGALGRRLSTGSLLRRCAGLALAVLATRLPAQEGSRLVGSVSARATRMPIVGAEVLLPALGRSARANATGDFELRALPAGTQQVLIRYPGFRPLRLELTFSGRDTVIRDVLLDADSTAGPATVLATVPIVGKADPILPASLREFERRRSTGFGHFIPPEELEKQRGRRLSDVLRVVPGLQIACTPKFPRPCFAATGRGTMSLEGRRASICFAQIYLDGARIYSEGSVQAPPNLNEFSVDQLAAIEFYAGDARTPAEFNATGSACGTLVLWTRVR